MIDDAEISSLVSLLTKLTVKEKLVWEESSPPSELVSGTDERVPDFFTTDYKNQYIGIAEIRYQGYDGDNERHYWTSTYALIFMDRRGRMQWRSKTYVAGIESLYEVVRNSVFDVGGIFENLLSKDSNDD